MRSSVSCVEQTISQIDKPCQRKKCFSSRYRFAFLDFAFPYSRDRAVEVLASAKPALLVLSRAPKRPAFGSACRIVSEKGHSDEQ